MHYTGLIFRPPYEERSLLLQVTTGCSHNKCTFCSMYLDTPFSVSPMEEVEEDILYIARHNTLFKRVFLVNGDAFCLSTERLVQIAELIHKHLPRIKTIGGYASIRNILGKSVEELRMLAELGYADFNIGLESGLDDVLAFMNKGYTLEEARTALARLNEAGMPFNLNIITCAAGRGRTLEHAEANARIVNEARPTLVFVSPLHVDKGARLEQLVDSGEFQECVLRDYITEEAEFVRRLELDDCIFFGLHVSNPVRVSGRLPEDKDLIVEELEAALNFYPEWRLNAVPAKGAEGRMIG